MTDQLKRAISAAQTAQTDATDAASGKSDNQHFDMSESTYKTSHTAVRKARRFAMQGLYEWLVTDRRFEQTDKRSWKDNAPHDIAARTRATNAMHTVHIGYYHEMMRDIPEQIDALDALISQHLDRDIDKLDTVEHAILLIGAYELQNRLEIPYKVVLDEAMKLNNHFGATDAHKLINAVLDRMAIDLRAIEVQADSKANLRSSQKAAAKLADTEQTQRNEDATAADIDSESTASTKPRISANKTGIKRSRSNQTHVGQTNAGTATDQKEVKMADDIANIDSEDNPISVPNTAVELPSKENSAVEAVEEDEFLDTTDDADIGLENSNLLGSKDKVSEESKDNGNKDNSSEAKDES
ncbi:transcription antitermination factor NusB [uncultured Psychrobacter sp.]|uniref:transcription antitermination factor NusB n=1 Tax=uncultured Psychrobacter sp. TaxID=259303 RepID=UPI00345B2FB9